MKTIKLTKGQETMVDDEDYEFLMQWKWHLGSLDARRKEARRGENGKTVKMHRVIMNCPTDKVVDHINGNGLDNRRSNLRITDTNWNNKNTAKRSHNKSGFKGVVYYFDKRCKNQKKVWMASINFNKKKMTIGYYEDKISAAIAYNEASKKYFGEFARLNEIPKALEGK